MTKLFGQSIRLWNNAGGGGCLNGFVVESKALAAEVGGKTLTMRRDCGLCVKFRGSGKLNGLEGDKWVTFMTYVLSTVSADVDKSTQEYPLRIDLNAVNLVF